MHLLRVLAAAHLDDDMDADPLRGLQHGAGHIGTGTGSSVTYPQGLVGNLAYGS